MDKTIFYTALASTISGTFVAVSGIWIKEWVQDRSKNRQDAIYQYQKLKGFNRSLSQLEMNKAKSYALCELFAARMDQGPENEKEFWSNSFINTNKYASECEEGVRKEKRELFELLASISITYRDEKLNELIAEAYDIKSVNVTVPEEYKTLEEVELWFERISGDIRTLVKDSVNSPIESVTARVEEIL